MSCAVDDGDCDEDDCGGNVGPAITLGAPNVVANHMEFQKQQMID